MSSSLQWINSASATMKSRGKRGGLLRWRWSAIARCSAEIIRTPSSGLHTSTATSSIDAGSHLRHCASRRRSLCVDTLSPPVSSIQTSTQPTSRPRELLKSASSPLKLSRADPFGAELPRCRLKSVARESFQPSQVHRMLKIGSRAFRRESQSAESSYNERESREVHRNSLQRAACRTN